MKWFIKIGMLLISGTIVTNRFIHRVPDWLQITLYGIALVLLIAGMLLKKSL